MWSQKRQNKYKNVRQTYQGYNYQSKKEAQKAFELDILAKAGQIENWDRQIKIPLEHKGHHICNYYVDFLVLHNGKILPEGTLEYIEIKSPITMTDTWRLKWKLFEADMDGVDGVKLTVEI